jgi:hypothetical protein
MSWLASNVRNLYNQSYPPAPTFTEEDVPSQQGKVFVVTGGNAGVGFELIKLLYPTGATVYMASRSQVSRNDEVPITCLLQASNTIS